MQEMSSDFRELFALLVLTIKNTTRGEDMYQVLKQYLLNPLVPCVPKNGTGTPRGITFCVAVRRYKFVSQLVQNSQNHKLGYERA